MIGKSRLAARVSVAFVTAIAVTACSAATGAGPQVDSSPSASPSNPSNPSTGQAVTPIADASPQLPDPAVKVDWSGGREVAGMEIGIPNPPGWYDRAFGGPTSSKVVYLTFDDGPRQPDTTRLLSSLDQFEAKVTFFVVGQQVQLFPQLVKQEAQQGQAIGDHTQSHADLISLPSDQVRSELTQVRQEVGAAMGPCMRPPYGLIDQKVAAVAQSLDLVPILWTGQASDWDNPPVEQIVSRLKQATEPGAVLLLHDGGGDRRNTVDAVERLLPWWQEQGYRLESVPACR